MKVTLFLYTFKPIITYVIIAIMFPYFFLFGLVYFSVSCYMFPFIKDVYFSVDQLKC